MGTLQESSTFRVNTLHGCHEAELLIFPFLYEQSLSYTGCAMKRGSRSEALLHGTPNGNRTRVSGMRTRRPSPLDDGGSYSAEVSDQIPNH